MLKKIVQEIRELSDSEKFAEADASCLAKIDGSGFVYLWLTLIGQNNIEVEWSAEHLVLYGAGEISERQIGYESEDWEKSWISVGNIFSNPIILDTSSGVISLAKHGMGGWSPVRVTDDIDSFFMLIHVWCQIYYREFKRNILDEDYEVSDAFLDCLSNKVNAEVGDKIHWAGVLFAVRG